MTKLAVGSIGPKFQVGPLTRTHFVRYAGASADFNPFHHDDNYARAAGYPSVFAHGMFSAGLLSSYLVKWFGPECMEHLAVRFQAQVWPGDTLYAEAKVASIDMQRQTARLDLSLKREHGQSVVTGFATVRLGEYLPEDSSSSQLHPL